MDRSIPHLAVSGDFRGQGCGPRIFRWLVDEARRRHREDGAPARLLLELEASLRRRLWAAGEKAGWGDDGRTMFTELFSVGVLSNRLFRDLEGLYQGANRDRSWGSRRRESRAGRRAGSRDDTASASSSKDSRPAKLDRLSSAAKSQVNESAAAADVGDGIPRGEKSRRFHAEHLSEQVREEVFGEAAGCSALVAVRHRGGSERGYPRVYSPCSCRGSLVD